MERQRHSGAGSVEGSCRLADSRRSSATKGPSHSSPGSRGPTLLVRCSEYLLGECVWLKGGGGGRERGGGVKRHKVVLGRQSSVTKFAVCEFPNVVLI